MRGQIAAPPAPRFAAAPAGCYIPRAMLRRLYDWTIAHAASRRAPWVLAAVAFTESSFFPIPPDVLLVPMALAARERAFRYAAICTVASVIGGLAGYAIGHFMFETLGRFLISIYGGADGYEKFRCFYAEWGALVILVKGLTPIPYKIVTIASGVAGYDLIAFTLLSVVTRAGRFFLVAALVYWFGPPIREFIERRLTLATTLFAVGLVGGFVALKYLLPSTAAAC